MSTGYEVVQKCVVKRKAVLAEGKVERVVCEREGGEVGKLYIYNCRLCMMDSLITAVVARSSLLRQRRSFSKPISLSRVSLIHSQSHLWAVLTLGRDASLWYIRTTIDGGRESLKADYEVWTGYARHSIKGCE
jgi:hypothetical protein